MRTERGFFCRAPVLFQGLLIISLSLPLGSVSAQAPFYKDKTITIIQGRRAGGTGDMRARAVMPFLQKYIPGNPAITTQYLPGAAGRRAVNHIYRSARPDGLTIGNSSSGFLLKSILGAAGIRFDMHKLIYLGSSYSENHNAFLSRKEAGLSSLEKLRSTPGIRIGGQSVGHVIYVTGRLLAYLLALRDPKFVTGYSGPEMDAALLRGEIDARASSAANILKSFPEWIDKGLMDFHAVLNIPKGLRHPRFGHLPEMETFAKMDREKKVIALFRTVRQVGGPFMVPPNTPPDRVNTLRTALQKTFSDPEFRRLFLRLSGGEASPISGEAIEKALREMPRDPEVTELLKKLAGPGPLPPR